MGRNNIDEALWILHLFCALFHTLDTIGAKAYGSPGDYIEFFRLISFFEAYKDRIDRACSDLSELSGLIPRAEREVNPTYMTCEEYSGMREEVKTRPSNHRPLPDFSALVASASSTDVLMSDDKNADNILHTISDF